MCRLVCLRCQQLNLASVSGSSRLLVSSLVASLAGNALEPRNTVLSCVSSRVLSRVSRVGGHPTTTMSIVRAAERRRRDSHINSTNRHATPLWLGPRLPEAETYQRQRCSAALVLETSGILDNGIALVLRLVKITGGAYKYSSTKQRRVYMPYRATF